MSGVVECYRRVSNRLWAVESVSNRPVLLSSSARSRAAGSASLWTLTFGHTCGFTPGTGPTFARSTAAIKSLLSPPTWNHTSWHTPKPKTTSDLRPRTAPVILHGLHGWCFLPQRLQTSRFILFHFYFGLSRLHIAFNFLFVQVCILYTYFGGKLGSAACDHE